MNTIEVIPLGNNKIKIIGANDIPEAGRINNSLRMQSSSTDNLSQFFCGFHSFFQKLAINISDKDEIYGLTINLLEKQSEFIKQQFGHYMKSDYKSISN